MTSFFTVTLDTMAPGLIMTVPLWTLKTCIPVIVQSDEPLDKWQEVYVLDSKGKRHDFTLAWEEYSLAGTIAFQEIASGIALLHVGVRDRVFNSTYLEANISVADYSIPMQIEYGVETRPFLIDIGKRHIAVSADRRIIRENIRTRDPETDIQTREVAVSTENEV